MDNRKRANGITLGIFSILLGVIILIATFPFIFMNILFISVVISALYFLFKVIRNVVEDHLDEEDKLNKWKQDRNIK
jgi:ABC-type bacteriocin/lantibiotic exporter with double-glycine peptidase domain